MSTNEKQKMYTANHKACTLAESMRNCQACIFNPDYVGMSESKVTELTRAALKEEVKKVK